MDAFEDAIHATGTDEAPWYVIPPNRKWFRNLAVSQIITDAMADFGLAFPAPPVNLAAIRRTYHAAVEGAWDLEGAKRGRGFDPSAVLGPSFARRMKSGRGLGSVLDRLTKKIVCRSGSRGLGAASIAFLMRALGGRGSALIHALNSGRHGKADFQGHPHQAVAL
jgi:Polyphosphate kinase 2 (PPK2)